MSSPDFESIINKMNFDFQYYQQSALGEQYLAQITEMNTKFKIKQEQEKR